MIKNIARIWFKRPEIGVIFVSVLLVLSFGSSTDGVYWNSRNIREVFRVTSILAMLAVGETIVVATGEIDISIGSIFGISGLVYIGLSPDIGALPAIVLALIAATLIGFFNGAIISYFKIPSLVVTLGSLFMFRGLAIAATEKTFSYSITRDMREDSVLRLFGGGDVLDYNNAIIWAILFVLVLQFVFIFTPIGNRVLAVGGDAASAKSRGISVSRVKLGAFVASGFFAGLAGILEGSDLGFVDGSFGRLMELQAIAAVVIGGTALLGGRASPVGTLFGAFILSAIQSYLVIKSIQPQWFTLILGAIIVLVSLFDRLMNYSLLRFSR